MSTKKSAPKKMPPLRKRKAVWVLYVVAGMMALVLLTWLATKLHRDYTIRNEQRSFKQAESDLRKISDGIRAIYPPEKINSSKTCSEISTKFETPPIYCDLGYELTYAVRTPGQATTMVKAIHQYMLDQGFSKRENGSPDHFVPLSEEPQQNQPFLFHIPTPIKLDCYVSYAYISSKAQYEGEYLLSSSDETLIVGPHCSAEVKQALYSLSN